MIMITGFALAIGYFKAEPFQSALQYKPLNAKGFQGPFQCRKMLSGSKSFGVQKPLFFPVSPLII